MCKGSESLAMLKVFAFVLAWVHQSHWRFHDNEWSTLWLKQVKETTETINRGVHQQQCLINTSYAISVAWGKLLEQKLWRRKYVWCFYRDAATNQMWSKIFNTQHNSTNTDCSSAEKCHYANAIFPTAPCMYDLEGPKHPNTSTLNAAWLCARSDVRVTGCGGDHVVSQTHQSQPCKVLSNHKVPLK